MEKQTAALKLIAEMPTTDEFNHDQVKVMHQFMLGWRNYNRLIRIAREGLSDMPEVREVEASEG